MPTNGFGVLFMREFHTRLKVTGEVRLLRLRLFNEIESGVKERHASLEKLRRERRLMPDALKRRQQHVLWNRFDQMSIESGTLRSLPVLGLTVA